MSQISLPLMNSSGYSPVGTDSCSVLVVGTEGFYSVTSLEKEMNRLSNDTTLIANDQVTTEI